MKYLILTFTISVLSACSSTPTSVVQLDKIGEEKVLQTHGDDDLKSADQFRLDGHTYISTGFSAIPGDHRVEAGIKLAQANARSLIAKTVGQKLESYLQVSNEGTSGDAQGLREVITESSKLDTSEWIPGKTFFEKVKVISDSGIPRTEYRIYSEIKLDEQTFKRQVVEAIRAQQGKEKSSAAFAKSVGRNWDKLLGGEAVNEEKRSPANNEE